MPSRTNAAKPAPKSNTKTIKLSDYEELVKDAAYMEDAVKRHEELRVELNKTESEYAKAMAEANATIKKLSARHMPTDDAVKLFKEVIDASTIEEQNEIIYRVVNYVKGNRKKQEEQIQRYLQGAHSDLMRVHDSQNTLRDILKGEGDNALTEFNGRPRWPDAGCNTTKN